MIPRDAWLGTALLITVAVASQAKSFPKAPPFLTPPFDTTHVARAIGKVVPSGGTGFVVSPTGLVLTAYHVVQPCVVHLRRSPTTRQLFDGDGSYDGGHGPLLCPQLRIVFPSAKSAEPSTAQPAGQPLFLIAVPPVRDAVVLRIGSLPLGIPPLSGEYPVPPADLALLMIPHPGRDYLRLATQAPRVKQPLWAAGYLEYTRRSIEEGMALQHSYLPNIQDAKLSTALYRALAKGTTDRGQGAKAASDFLASYKPPSWFATDLQTDPPWALVDLREAAKGPAEIVAVIRRQLESAAEEDEKMAKRPDVDPIVAAAYGRAAQELRKLAQAPQGSTVRNVMLAFIRSSAQNTEILEEDVNGDYSMYSHKWLGIPAFFGPVSHVDAATFRSDAYGENGMSGGPVLDSGGEVLGVMTMGRHYTLAYRPDNLIIARSDAILKRFGRLLKKSWKLPPTPAVRRAQ